MSAAGLRHVYGPVPSRRLGRSLGVDLVPFKTCTYDCIYCQLGGTTDLTTARREYVPVDQILVQLEEKLRVGPAPDYVSLAGSGEPTLHARIGELIAGIKRLTPVPVAILTNGSLLGARDIQDALLEADLVLPSLDAGDADLFRLVNRPHAQIEFAAMVDGLVAFRERFAKPVWLEVMLLAGITGIRFEVEKIAALARRIRPDRVQVNTITRPPCEEFAYPVPPESMASFARLFGRGTGVVSEHRTRRAPLPPGAVTDGDILALLSRRPCTAWGISEGLGLHLGEVTKRLDVLTDRRAVASVRKDGAVFFETVRGREPEDDISHLEGAHGVS
jgi:wyosine [tRNA(Phe)-imidazoG37] synthetase (radical SAM superfamily)